MAPLDVTPTKIAEMLYRIIQDPMRKVQVEELGKEYAAGKCDKDKLMECLQYVATGKEMTQALRVLVPGYDEMCGGSPPAAAAVLGPAMPTDVSDPDEKAAAEAKAVAEAKAAEKAAMPNLKKGFLSGKSLAPKQAASSAAPTVAAGSKAAAAAPTLDTTTPNPHLFREQYHQHMHEAMPEMDPKTQEHIMHNNFVMHDQERAGNGGNVTIDSNGRATVRTDDDLGGAADGYTWGQNESEVTIKVKVAKGTRGKDVKLKATSVSAKVEVHGRVVLDGQLHAPVVGDDSTFIIEDDADAKTSGGRLLTVTLAKAHKTAGHSHWPCVVEGAPRIDPSKFGPQVLTANPDNPNELIERMNMLADGKQAADRKRLEDKVV